MDELERFARGRAAAIGSYEQDTAFQTHSLAWVLEAMSKRYVYNFDWLGRPIIQYPQDLQAMQEIVSTSSSAAGESCNTSSFGPRMSNLPSSSATAQVPSSALASPVE